MVWALQSDPATTIEYAGSRYERGAICSVCLARLDSTRVFECGPIRLDLHLGVVEIDGKIRAVQPQRVALLAALMRQPGKVFSKETLDTILAEAVNGEHMDSSRIVDVQLCRLRKEIEPYRDMIQTVWGVGVRLIPPRQEV